MLKSRQHAGPKATVGTVYKLVSAKGTLLGVLTVPDWIADMFSSRDFIQFPIRKPLRFELFDENKAPKMTSLAALCKSYEWEWSDAVQVRGVSIEELEKQPGFSFAPSAAYLRSMTQ